MVWRRGVKGRGEVQRYSGTLDVAASSKFRQGCVAVSLVPRKARASGCRKRMRGSVVFGGLDASKPGEHVSVTAVRAPWCVHAHACSTRLRWNGGRAAQLQ